MNDSPASCCKLCIYATEKKVAFVPPPKTADLMARVSALETALATQNEALTPDDLQAMIGG